MRESLVLFMRIMNHLEYLTTKDDFGSRRSKGIGTREELAEELNSENIVPKRGYWTTHSLELFFNRMLKQYGAEHLWELCDIRFLNAQNWEYISGTCQHELVGNRSGKTQNNSSARMSFRDAAAGTFKTTSDDLWKAHEGPELNHDFHKNIREYKSFLRRKRRFDA